MTGWTAEFKAEIGSFNIDVSVEGPKGVLAIIGPNGSGKTSFLRLLTGAIQARTSQFKIADRIIADSKKNIEIPTEKRNIAYVPQGQRLFPHLSVLDNVTFALSLGPLKVDKDLRNSRGIELLSTLGCDHLAYRSTQSLSGGEAQKVAIARALIVKPDLLLLDEPLAALDPVNRRSTRIFLKTAIESLNKPTIIATHDVKDLIAFQAIACVFDSGRIIQRGSLEMLKQSPASPFIQAFIDD